MKFTKSMIDVAEECLKNTGTDMSFTDIYNEVAKVLEMSDEEKDAHIGRFYTDLTLDGRFVALTDNHWDLRSRHIFEKVHIDTKAAYSDEEGDQDPTDKQDNQEYDAAMQGQLLPTSEGEEGEEGVSSPDDEMASLV